jgi:hypothetical protein
MLSPTDPPVTAPEFSEFDTQALQQRADQWRIEAAQASSADMRVFCISEAENCERRLQRSFDTPVLIMFSRPAHLVPIPKR